jgi:hypothetical protein
VWAIESTGGYGAGLTPFLSVTHEQVVELDRPKRTARRHGAKSDPASGRRPAGGIGGAARGKALGGSGDHHLNQACTWSS